MAIVKQYRLWNKIPVEIRSNTETAEVQVWTDSRITLIPGQLASKQRGKSWVVDNKDLLARNFNGANGTNSSPSEVEKAYLTQGYKVFDNDHAAALNNNNNYTNQQQAIILRQQYSRNVPGVKNPVTGTQANSNGDPTTQPVVASPDPTTSPTTSGSSQVTAGASVESGGSTDASGSADVPTIQERQAQPQQEPVKAIEPKIDPNTIPPPNPPILRYPKANLDVVGEELGISYDFIKIRVVNHISSLDPNVFFGEQDRGPEEQISRQLGFLLGNKNLSNRYKQYSDPFATVILPMQPNLSTSNSVDWGSDSLNIAQLVGGQLATNYFQGISPGGGKNPLESIRNVAIQAIQSLGVFADIGINNSSTIAALMAGYLVGNNSIATRATGAVINPNMEMLFNGPRLRTFNFQFDMTPRFKEEADEIKKIIKLFKKYMSPYKTSGNAFLKSPKIFLLDYIYNGNIKNGVASGDTHPYLNKFKPCALTEFNVNYTPDGSYMTYKEDGSMTRYSISMSFAEIEPIYQNDYDDDINDMGY